MDFLMLKMLFAKRRIKKLITFYCALALTLIIASIGTTADSYDTSEIQEAGNIAVLPAKGRNGRLSGLTDLEYTDFALESLEEDEYESLECYDQNVIFTGTLPDPTELNVQYAQNESDGLKASGNEKEEFAYQSDIPLSEELQLYTYEQCLVNGLDYSLVLALMWRESRFQLDAVNLNSNGTADTGIMQINDVNRQWISEELGITNLSDPMDNIRAGTVLLGRLTEKYGEHYALMAYQYGETGMERKISQGVTTNQQIQALYTKRDYYESLYG